MTSVKNIISNVEKQIFLNDDTGHAKMQVYQVFPGVELVYNSIHMGQCKLGNPKDGTFVEIRYCKEGRIECDFEDEYYYLTAGDLSVSIRNNPPDELDFPTKHYHGITIGIHVETAPKCFSCFLEDVKVDPLNVAKRLCKDTHFFVFKGKKYVKNIFAGLWERDFPEHLEIGYFKIKVLELLYVLSKIEPERNISSNIVISQAQMTLAKTVSEYLTSNVSEKISVTELADKFHVSQKHLQHAFKGVYGMSVYIYMRNLKMKEAARKILKTNLSITEIATYYGYDNPSKFSVAFQKVMGETPLNYRKANKNS